MGPAGARATRDFEDMIAWLAQWMDKTSVSRLLSAMICGQISTTDMSERTWVFPLTCYTTELS